MEHLEIWTVYDRPLDFPGNIVVRCSRVYQDGRIEPAPNDSPGCALFLDLKSAREWLEKKALTRIPRAPFDQPHIVECWL